MTAVTSPALSPADPAEARRSRLAERAGLSGWFLAKLVDGETDGGAWLSWYGYEHLDGRRATVFPDGSCTDPELQALLAAQHSQQAPMASASWLGRLLARALSLLWPGRG